MEWLLKTLSSNLQEFNQYIKANAPKVNEFLSSKLKGATTPIFTSVDIRNAGFKIAPVDTNLFPAGFNNLSEAGRRILCTKLKEYIKHNYPHARRVLIFPENFTRNLNYLDNLVVLIEAVSNAGFDVKLGSTLINDDFIAIEKALSIESFHKMNEIITNKTAWVPDLIVLNNDLTSGIPEALKGCSIPIIPAMSKGWYARRKHNHFLSYNNIITEFCKASGIDPWLLSTEFRNCEQVDFRSHRGLYCVAASVDEVIAQVQNNYTLYGIKEEPFAFVKADQGTYGMGIMVVRSGKEILKINKKHRHSMQSLKQGVPNTTIIVQEGIPTIEKHSLATAETMAYLCAVQPLELFDRWHEDKDKYSSLNTPGMKFSVQNKSDILYDLKCFIAQVAAVATIFEESVQ